MTNDQPVVFISYAWNDFDTLVAEKLDTYLKVLSGVEIFYDKRKLEPGQLITAQVLDALDRAVVAVTILSADYVDPDRFTARVELPAIMKLESEGRLVVLPVISRPLPLDHFAFFEDRLAVNRLSDPLSRFGVGHHRFDQALVAVFQRVKKIVTSGPGAVGGSGRRVDPAEPVTVRALSGGLARVHGAPALLRRYFPRQEVDSLRSHLSSNDVLGLSGREDAYGLSGDGGIGKTVIALALAWDDAVRRRFSDGIYWLTVGEDTNSLSVQAELCRQMQVIPAFQNALEGRAFLREKLTGRRVLVILDDVWSASQLADLVVTDGSARTLVTTRSDQRVLRPLGVPCLSVARLDPDEGVRFLHQFVTDPERVTDDQLRHVADQVRGVPLALALVGSALRSGQAVEETLRLLATDEFGDHPYATQFRAHRVAAEIVRETDATAFQRYLSLATFPPDIEIPVTVVSRLWTYLYPAHDRAATHRELVLLEDLGLLTRIERDGQARAYLHDLNHTFTRLDVDSTLASLHGALIASFRVALPNPHFWWELPDEESYFWEWLTYHLEGAGEPLHTTISDPRFIARKLQGVGLASLLEDFRRAISQDERRAGAVDEISRLVRAVDPLVRGLTGIRSVAATLACYWTLPGRRDLKDLSELVLVPVVDVLPGNIHLHLALQAHAEPILAVDWSADGRYVATGSVDHSVKVWRFDTGELVCHIRDHRRPVHGLRWSPDGYFLATVCGDLVGVDNALRVWDVSGDPRMVLQAEHPSRATTVDWSPDGTLVVTGCEDSMVRVWDLRGNPPQLIATEPVRGPVCQTCWSPDGAFLAVVYDDGVWIRFDAQTFAPDRDSEGMGVHVRAVAWSPDSGRIALGGTDRLVGYQELHTEGLRIERLYGAQTNINAIAWSPRGPLAAAGGNIFDVNGTVWIWNPENSALVDRFTGHTDRVNSLSWSPDGSALLSGAADGTAMIWSAARLGRQRPAGEIRQQWPQPVTAMAVAPGAARVALALGDFTSAQSSLVVLESERLDLIVQLESPHILDTAALSWAPGGDRLASGGADGSVWITEPIGTGAKKAFLLTLGDRIRALRWSPSGSELIVCRQAAGAQDLLEIWDLGTRTSQHGRTFEAGWIVTSLALSNDGTALAVGFGDALGRGSGIEILGYPDLRTRTRLPFGRHRVTGVAWSAEDDHVAVVSAEGVLRLIRPEAGDLGDTAERVHRAAGVGVTWLGSSVVTVGNDLTLRIAESDSPTSLTLGLVNYPVAVEQFTDGKSLVLATRQGVNVLTRLT